MATRETNIRRYQSLVAQGRCTVCASKLPAGDGHRRCRECRKLLKIKTCSGVAESRRKLMDERIAYIVKTKDSRTAMQQAMDLGIPVNTIYDLRNKARRRGFDVHREWGRKKQSARWQQLETSQACSRCHLRGDHECMASIYELASSRRGEPVLPEGGP